MSKRKTHKQNKKNNSTVMFAGLLAIVVLIAGGLFFANSGNTDGVVADIVRETISPQDYQTSFADSSNDHILIDVRTPEEFASGHIRGAVNIPVQELQQRLSEIPADKEIVVYCRSGNRSAQASTILANNGFSGIYDLGGIIAWQQAGYTLES